MRPIVGMVHLPSLPGAANATRQALAEVIELACEDARRLELGGIDAILLQNANDHPPRKVVPAATIAAYAVVAAAVRHTTVLPLGICVLKSDPTASFAIAMAASADFIRLKGYVGAEVGAEGIVEGCAAEAVRLRHESGMPIEIWADAVQPTSRPLGNVTPVDLIGWCVEFGEADRVIVTGSSLEDSLAILNEGRRRVSVPLVLGGGVAPATASRGLAASDGVIVGRYLRGGGLDGPIDVDRVREFVAAARGTTPGDIDSGPTRAQP